MSAKQAGFTLIELMIVIAIIAIIAAIAIPNLLAARLSANETAAVATLRNIISAQTQFQQSAKADGDGDGTGEYAGFIELSGAGIGRIGELLVPPVLSGSFRVLNAQGQVSRSGYLFKIFLPVDNATALGEPQAGYSDGDVDQNLAETTWCVYAWPVHYSQSGNRTFFTNQAGDVLATEDASYTGLTCPLSSDANASAAFASGNITGVVALGNNTVGQDGNTWKQVN